MQINLQKYSKTAAKMRPRCKFIDYQYKNPISPKGSHFCIAYYTILTVFCMVHYTNPLQRYNFF